MPTSSLGEVAEPDFEWPVSAETLDACEIVISPTGPHLIVEPGPVPPTARVVEGAPLGGTKDPPLVRYESPARKPGMATPEDFARWSAALTARQTAPAEPRRVGFAVLGGLCCALLAYVDLTMAPGGTVMPPPPPVRAAHTSYALSVGLETDAPARAVRIVSESRAQPSRLNLRKAEPAKTAMATVRRVIDKSPPKAGVRAPVTRVADKEPAAPASRPPLALSSQGEPVPDAASASPSLSSVSPTLPASSSKPADADDIRSTLTRFRAAYSTLNAKAARAVWPTVDERALARAFSGLKSQAIAFDRCQTIVEGVRASAACEGRSTYIPRIGGGSPRTDARHWNFALRKVGDQWTIDSASFR